MPEGYVTGEVRHEALADGRIRLPGLSDASGSGSNLTPIKPEVKYGDSRFDFYVEAGGSIPTLPIVALHALKILRNSPEGNLITQ